MAEKTLTNIIGSSIEDFAIDPVTGKKRTSEEIVKAALAAGIANVSPEMWGTSYDEATGTTRAWNEAEKANAILAQLAATAKREAPYLGSASGVSSALGSDNQYGSTRYFLKDNPSAWQYDKSQVGKIFKQGDQSRYVIDPNNPIIPKNILDEYAGKNIVFIDPITGQSLSPDLQTGKILDWNAPSFSNQMGVAGNLAGGNLKSNTGANLITGGVGTGTGTGAGAGAGSGAFGPGSEGYKDRKSAYDILYGEFKKYGLESLVEEIKNLVTSNVSPSEFSIALQNTESYKKRFAANQERIKQGLRALTPAEYIGLEDQYQNIMRNYGLPASYWSKDSMGTQSGFNKFIANDVSAAELEDRIATAQKRVLNADVNVMDALKAFYPDITKSDILAYTLDPTNALEDIKRKVTASEIQGAAMQQGLNSITGATPAEQIKAYEARARELAGYGVTKAQAQQGYGAIAEFLPTGQKLSDIYAKQGLGDYNQATAEQEVFGTAGSAAAGLKRRKLSELEKAAFSGTSGTSQGALARDRALGGAF